VLGTATLTNGSASLSTLLPAGTYSITATYGGTATYGASTSTTSAGSIFNVAGNGTFGNTVTPAGVAAASAELANPYGVAVGPNGTVFIADTSNNQIDAFNPNTGNIVVLAGNGTAGLVDGSLLSAEFFSPRGLAFDATRNSLFVADRDNNAIREISLTSNQVTTVAGTGTFGNGGNNIQATSAALGSPSAVAVGPTGQTLFIADTFNNLIRQVILPTGIITTIAGNGTAGFTGDGGPATSAELFDPSGVAVDNAGNVYVADTDNNVVRKVTASTQVITTIAGTPPPAGPAPTDPQPNAGYSGDNGPATSAKLFQPFGLALNGAGTALYIADSSNNAIRRINLTTGIITTFAGNGTFGSTGNNGPATSATLGSPRSVVVDASGNVFIADTLGGPNPQGATGGSIRLVAGGSSTASVAVEPFASIAPGFTTVIANRVPTGLHNKKAQGIVLALAKVTNPAAARLRSSYLLSTPPNRAGKVKHIRINRVTFDTTTDVVRIFPRTRLNAHKTYRLIIVGQSARPVTLLFNRASIISETA
jgi:sugar lactone lactonase YvrE